jgi:hypothetical protein
MFGLDMTVTIQGFRGTRKLMRQLEPDLLKDLDKTVRQSLEPVLTRAPSRVPDSKPLSGWKTPLNPGSRPSYSPYGRRWDYNRLEWNAGQARQNIVVRRPGRRPRGKLTRPIYQLQSNNPAASVFELMGRGKSGVNMIGNVFNRFPGTGRVLYRAFDSLGGKAIERDVVDTIRKFEAEFNRRLDVKGLP